MSNTKKKQDELDRLHNVLILAAILACFIWGLSGCSSMPIEYEQDKIDAIEIPENVTIHYYGSRYEYQEAVGNKWCGHAIWESVGGKCDIYLVKKASILKHELKHCELGYWHGNNREYETC